MLQAAAFALLVEVVDSFISSSTRPLTRNALGADRDLVLLLLDRRRQTHGFLAGSLLGSRALAPDLEPLPSNRHFQSRDQAPA